MIVVWRRTNARGECTSLLKYNVIYFKEKTASIRQCLTTFAEHRVAFLIVSRSCVSRLRKTDRLNFSRLQEPARKLSQYWSNRRHPGLLPPCPVNPWSGFSHQDPHFVFKHRTYRTMWYHHRLPAMGTFSRLRAAIITSTIKLS